MSTNGTPLEIRELRAVYRKGRVSLADSFFSPCLKYCSTYWRAAGYFSSSALKTWSVVLTRLVTDQVGIRLLISPKLTETDAAALRAATDDQQRQVLLDELADHIIEETVRFSSDPEDVQTRIRLLTWMIASGRLELRFAILKDQEDEEMFHEKSGLFFFPWGHKVAFTGSPNESEYGHERNYEKVHVFRSWISADDARVISVEEDFVRQWEGHDEALIVRPLSKKSLDLIRIVAQQNPHFGFKPAGPPKLDRWRHQEAAKNMFLSARRGVLEMATGTGKTRTALSVLQTLFDNRQVNSAIISTDGTDLLDQWLRTLLASDLVRQRHVRVLTHYAENHQGPGFALNPTRAILIISRGQLPAILRLLNPQTKGQMIIVHDEVHGLGAPQSVAQLKGTHQDFAFTLGLSATPEREYDEAGSAFIESEVGPVIFQFGLREAIERGILVEFDYVSLKYRLTADDKRRLSAVYSKQAARKKEGHPMSQEELWTELARVYKTAEEKPLIFRGYLQTNHHILSGAIIFVEERSYGDRILPLLDPYTNLYRTYYAEDDRDNLVKFARGELDCLVTCHRVSQGIDIRHLRTVVLFSAARGRLETIQRIGRCLRTDPLEPDKRALVIDFVLEKDQPDDSHESADEAREKWLADLSTVTRKE